jgi:glycosyltransferase involved in cell wall biosynthesis
MYPNRSEELQPRPLEMSLSLRGQGDRKQETGASEQTAYGQRHTESAQATDSSPVTRDSLQASAPLTLGYAGSVAYGYGEELVRLIPLLREVGARLRMFSPKPTGILDELNHATDVVEICGYRPALEAWKEIKESCDAVILPYSNPAGKYELLYRTHFPSKLSEYLALGMPVVVCGPEFATGLRYAQAEKLKRGKAEMLKISLQEFQTLPRGRLTEPRLSVSEFLHFAPNGAVPCMTREELVACLRRLREDGNLRRELAGRAVAAGQCDFDPQRIRESFWRILSEAAVQGIPGRV